MLSNRPEKGLDLLDAMVTAAADRASSHLPGAIRFAKCDGLQMGKDADEAFLLRLAVLDDLVANQKGLHAGCVNIRHKGHSTRCGSILKELFKLMEGRRTAEF